MVLFNGKQIAHLAVLTSRLLQLANGLAVSLAVIWHYGLASAGTLALASLPGAVASLAIAAGLPSALPRSDAGQGQRASLALLITTVGAGPTVLAVVLYAWALGRDPAEVVAIAALGISGGLSGMVNVQQTLYVLQGRAGMTPPAYAPLAPAIHLLGTGVAAAAHSLEAFSLILLATRVLGCAVGFLPLVYKEIEAGQWRPLLADTLRFTPLDLAGLLGEQLPVVLLSGLLTRAELGAFGLLRQFVTVADTPGWSFVFNHYPSLVEDTRGAGPAVARDNERLSWLAGAGCLFLASALAVFAYRVPIVAFALPVVLLPMPARYLSNFVEQTLRANGFVSDCAVLAFIRIGLSLLLFGTLGWWGGFWGAVAASALLSLGSGLLYRYRILVRFPGMLRPMRVWRLA